MHLEKERIPKSNAYVNCFCKVFNYLGKCFFFYHFCARNYGD